MLILVYLVISDVLSVKDIGITRFRVTLFPFCKFYSIIYRKYMIKFEPYKG